MSEKAKRIQSTDSDRRKICEIQKKNPAFTQDQVTVAASELLNKPVLKRPTITGILKESAKWLKVQDSSGNSKRHREAKWPVLKLF